MEKVILVDQNDNELGLMEKLEAHEKGLCHRAFSILLFRKTDNAFQALLHQRADTKYHCAGLWTNTCCSHPRPGETIIEAAHRRLEEEMSIQTELTYVDKFHYIASFENGLTENEIDHVLIGKYNQYSSDFNLEEVKAVKWLSTEEIEKDLASQPEKYTPWFPKVFKIAARYFVQLQEISLKKDLKKEELIK